MRRAYYNEIDPFAAAWLRELIKAGLIADGEVDERSIADVRPADLVGFNQCHFFAGIGGWSYALRLAGWDDNRPVWTGSAPCQPFSSAGAQTGGDDPRHLWPAWFCLIRECRPAVVFGEQVEAAIAHGWLDLVCDDLEREGYAVGAVGLPAAGVGAPHIRQRVWFVAESDSNRRRSQPRGRSGTVQGDQEPERPTQQSDRCRANVGELGDPSQRGQRIDWRASGDTGHVDESGQIGGMADANRTGQREQRREGLPAERDAPRRDDVDGRSASSMGHAESEREVSEHGVLEGTQPQPDGGFWSSCDWLPCRDGKARPVEPSIFPLASGVSNRVGQLRGAGNSIVPQVATAFIEAYVEARGVA